jgi:hypothetical protein
MGGTLHSLVSLSPPWPCANSPTSNIQVVVAMMLPCLRFPPAPAVPDLLLLAVGACLLALAEAALAAQLVPVEVHLVPAEEVLAVRTPPPSPCLFSISLSLSLWLVV